MELTDGVLHLGPFMAVTLGIIVLLVGKCINDSLSFPRELSIPEPVTGEVLYEAIKMPGLLGPGSTGRITM